jgi:epoxyqueuosine reductase QueG
MNEILQKIREFSSRHDIPIFGICRSSQLENAAPPGYRPSDVLPSAKSLFCLGIPVPEGVFKCEERANETYWRAASIYYRNIDAILMRLGRIIEETGETAFPVYGCFPYDVRGKGNFRGYLSLVKIGELVGIGKTGKNGLLFNPHYGPRLILGGLVTTAALPEIAWPDKENTGCPEGCIVCQENCPVGAIDKIGKVDRLACIKYSQKTPIFSYLMKTKSFDPADVQMLNQVTGVDDHAMYTCIKCVSTCPYTG